MRNTVHLDNGADVTLVSDEISVTLNIWDPLVCVTRVTRMSMSQWAKLIAPTPAAAAAPTKVAPTSVA